MPKIPSLTELCSEVFAKSALFHYLQLLKVRQSALHTSILPQDVFENLLYRSVRKATLNDETVNLFLHSFLRRLKLSGASSLLGDPTLDIIQKSCTRLEELSLYGNISFTEKKLCEMFQNLIKLEQVNLSRCASVSKRVLESISKNCPKLRVLVLNRNPQIEDSFLVDNLKGWPLLTELGLLSCFNISGQVLDSVAQNNKNLKVLNISRCTEIRDTHLLSLIKFCTNLKVLRMARLRSLTDAVLLNICQHLPTINTLEIPLCSGFTEQNLLKTFQICTQLTTIHLPRESEALLETIIDNCLNIEEIYLPRAGMVTDKSVSKLAKCTALKNLNISKCNQLNDSSIRAIFQHVTGLQEFYISNCNTLTSGVITGLTHVTNPNLTILDIGNTSILKTSFLMDMARFSPNLNTLNLSQTGIKDEEIQMLSRHFPKLEFLNLSDNSLDSNDVLTVSNGNWRLKELNMSGCIYIHADCIPVLLKNMGSLETLQLSRCKAIGALSHPLSKPTKKSDLIKLDLSHCNNISLEAFTEILNHCGNIQDLNLHACEGLADSILDTIANFKHLHTLNVSKLPISDRFVVKMSAQLKHLTAVNVAGCLLLTDLSGAHLFQKCIFLQTVHFTGCPMISDNSLKALLDNKENSKIQLLAVSDTAVSQSMRDEVVEAFPTIQLHWVQRKARSTNF